MSTAHRISRVFERMHGLRGWLSREINDARQQIFQVIAAIITALLFFALGLELLGKEASDAKLVSALVISLFAAAFLAAYGKEVAARIKKVGPIELLEGQKASHELDSIAGEGAHALGRSSLIRKIDSFNLDLTKVELSATEQFYYLESDKLLTHLKLSGSEPETGTERDVVWELLFKVGYTAMTQREWMKAIRWLRHLEKLSGATYRPSEVSNYLAFSILFSALQETEAPEELRQERLREAAQRFSKLAGRGQLDYQGYFWLAYAQDELTQWHEAVLSNHETLKRRPRFAPARYNLALSLLKLQKHHSACHQLKSIRPEDEKIGGISGDTEMTTQVEAVTDPVMRQKLFDELHRIQSFGI